MNRLLGLELLRGVAALLVLLEHLPNVTWIVCGKPAEMPAALMRCGGYWGVDFFFVLSGYLIGLTLDKPGTTARSFLLARLARVLPLYFVASAVCLALPATRFHEVSATMAVTTLTLLPVAGDALSPVTAHPYGWTLCFEMGFYLVATALTAAVGGRRAVGLMAVGFTLAPLAFTALGTPPGWDFPKFALCPLWAEFALGLLGYRLTGRLTARAGCALLALGLVGCAAGVAAFGGPGPKESAIADPVLAWVRVGTWGLSAFLCVSGLARLDRAGTFAPIARLATAAGALSYSLYLVQPIAFGVAAALAAALGVTRPWPAAVGTVAVTLALAALVARVIDRPLHELAKGWAARLAAKVPLAPLQPLPLPTRLLRTSAR